MEHVNKCLISGNLVKDPEIRQSKKGTPYTVIRLAVVTSENNTKETLFISVYIWAPDIARKTIGLKTGSDVSVHGRLKAFTIDKEGRKDVMYYIHAEEIIPGSSPTKKPSSDIDELPF